MAAKRKNVEAGAQQPDRLGAQFEEALRAAGIDSSDESPWERLEDAAVSQKQAGRLLELYQARLTPELGPELVEVLSHRVVRFAADCFGESAPEILAVLRRVLDVAPEAGWAFQQLVAALSTSERWAELLDAYDAQLGAAKSPLVRKDLLRDAANIAKDLARDPGRAIDYLSQLHGLAPSDDQVAASLERLLERQERWEDLLRFWRQRLERLSPPQARGLRQSIALALYEKLGRPGAALEEARALLAEEGDDAALTDLLERVLGDERAPVEGRLGALDLLRRRCQARGEADRMPALLQIAIGFSSGSTLLELRRECGERLEALGDLPGALDQYVALAALAPEDHAVEDRLRQLAEAAHDPRRLAEGLVLAADACASPDRRVELLTRAARIRDGQLGARADAAALYDRMLADATTPSQRLEALRRLEELHGELGDDRQRLGTLERLAAAEPRLGHQRLVWAQAAQLAEKLGDVDRAVAAWEARLSLAADAVDSEALAALTALLAGAERWPALVQVLRRRVQSEVPAHQVRADLVQIATIARERQGDLGSAIDAWRTIITRFGEDQESVAALADIFAEAGRFADLAELLSRNCLAERHRQADTAARLGDALRQSLGQDATALAWYSRALEAEPGHQVARAGLRALLADATLAPAAAEALARAAEATESWPLLLELLPHRLAAGPAPERKVHLYEQAAAHAGDDSHAFTWLCQALPQAPARPRLLGEVLRLAEATGDFARAAQALAEASASSEASPLLRAQLQMERARLLEERVGDLGGARACYAAALTLAPSDLELRQGLVRTAAAVGHWTEAAAAVVDPAVPPDVRETTLLPLYEARAAETESFRAAAQALGDATVQAEELAPVIRRDLHARVAGYFVDRCADAEAADGALARALELDPGHVPTLSRCVELQRQRPDRRLFDTLARLADEEPADLDHLWEAAEVALRPLADEGLRLETLARLWARATGRVQRSAAAAGRHQPAEAAVFALEEMVRLHEAAGTRQRTARAAALLLEGWRLPFDADKRRQWLRRAALLTESTLGDRPGAIDLWRMLNEDAPDDEAAHAALARLCEEEGRFAEAVGLRVLELEGAKDAPRRLALRLEIVRLAGLFEQKTSQPAALRANLAEQPGHPATIRKLTEMLTEKGRLGELADVLEEQARLLEERGETAGAAELWTQLARLAESALSAGPRAIAAWQRVATLEATVEALDALGRLELTAGHTAAAATWLERRLEMTAGGPRCEVSARLARAYLGANQRHRAIACLDRALGEFPRAHELRAMLAELYQAAEAWELQARILAEGCEFTEDVSELTANARRAMELYARVGMPGKAVQLLERMVRLVPQDESFRSALADGLSQSGRHDEARALLAGLIEDAGWRRSRKKAGLHHRLARVARAQGDLPAALEHLEHASGMDVANAEVLQELAEVAEAAGSSERAERAYRGLLVGKRQEGEAPAGDSAGGGLAVTEILLRLHDLAAKRQEGAEASELLESALAAAVTDAVGSARLQRALLDRKAYDVLQRLFERRLAQTAGLPAQADVYAEMSKSLLAQERSAEAFHALVQAVEMDPARADLHEAVVELARGQGKVDRLVDRLLAAAGKRRRRSEAPVVAALLLRAAELAETDLGDVDRAADLYRRAQEGLPASIDAISGLARLAQRRGDHAESARLVDLLKEKAGEGSAPEQAADALFRAAALELGQPATRAAGIASLYQAVKISNDVERATKVAGAAELAPEDVAEILPLYERVARQSGDERILLDYLERRAGTPGATVAEVREAVDLAVASNRPERVEPLLVRLADLAATQPDGGADVTWAMLELVHRRKASGDFEGAAQALERAAERLEPDRVMALARDLSERAARAGHLRLGAQLLERLRARTPADERVWRPLLAYYTELQDGEAVQRLIGETLPLLPEVGQRNELRLARARFELTADDRSPAAAEALRDVLMEEPGHAEALRLLADYYTRTEAEGDLIDLLEQRFEAAAQARDQEMVVEMALRLGDLLERSDGARAGELYGRALALVPGRRELIRRVLAQTPASELTRERLVTMEELLAVEEGPAAAALARELADAWTKLDDAEGVRRVLEKGCALVPADEALTERLEQCYREQEAWGPLAELLAAEAGRQTDTVEAAALLGEAATLRGERLGDHAGAVALLRRARERAPEDHQLLAQLARALTFSGQLGDAIAEVKGGLDGMDPGHEDRLALLVLLAELESARGDTRAAVNTLAQAYATWPDAAREPYAAALAAWREDATFAKDTQAVRDSTLVLAKFLRGDGELAQALQLLEDLLGDGRPDIEVARLAAELAEVAEDLERALACARRLVGMEEGEARIDAILHLVALAERLGRPAEAAAELEGALAANPGERRLFASLAQLYERAGEHRKLAHLSFDQANRTADEDERLQLLTNAGALLVQAGEGSVAMMAINEALAMRPGDEGLTLLLSDAYTLAGALDDAAELLKPLLAAHKGKASPALAALYLRLARIAAHASDTKAELEALARALDADKKNGALAAEVADRAEAVGDDEMALRALRAITLHAVGGPVTNATSFLRQARIVKRRGDNGRAVLLARRAAQEAAQNDPMVLAESRQFLETIGSVK
jgi:tetratricopeptide (TPR) repeat protein